jgi:ABC-type oligopeptide transport system substrate-binding subunit
MLLVIVSVALILGLIAACENPNQTSKIGNPAVKVAQVSTPTLYSQGYPTGFPTPVNHETFDALVEQNENTLKTEVALTPTPPEPT